MRLAAILVLVNVAVFLWPHGDKQTVLSPGQHSASDINAAAITLLAESSGGSMISTGLVAASARPDGRDAAQLPARPEPARDVSSTEAVQRDDLADGPSDPPESRDTPFRPLLLGARPDLNGGLRTDSSKFQTVSLTPPGELDDQPAVTTDAGLAEADDQSATQNAVSGASDLVSTVSDLLQTSSDDGAGIESQRVDVAKLPLKPKRLSSTRRTQPEVVGVNTNPVAENQASRGEVVNEPAPLSIQSVPEPIAAQSVQSSSALAALGSPACVRVGPFFSQPAFESTAKLLEDRGYQFNKRSVEARNVTAIRVVIGPFVDDKSLSPVTQKLKEAGIRDFYVMPQGTDIGRIVSLGLYSDEKTANTVVDQLAAFDLDVESREERRLLSATYWLETSGTGMNSEKRDALGDIPLGDRHARLKKMSCVTNG